MATEDNKIKKGLYLLCSAVSLLIILDFILPGTRIEAEIQGLKTQKENYYNAAQNSHFSYKMKTSAGNFFVDENFSREARNHESIQFSKSLIFKEVNWYRWSAEDSKSYYVLRLLSAIALPLIILFAVFYTWRFKADIEIMFFILQILLIADLIFVLQ